jgi:hypothetical protein
LPSRTGAPVPPARPCRGRSGRPRAATRRDRRCDERQRRIHLPPGPGRRSERPGRVAPRFALTLRAMFGTRQVSALASGRSILALSALALLALGCFPVLAHADSSEIEYQDAPPTVDGGKANKDREPSADSSKADGGASAPGGGSTGSGSSGGGSSAGGSSSNSGGAPGTANDGGAGQQGSAKGSYDSSVGPGKAIETAKPAASDTGGGSSPLVPVLIAVAALAAISLGALAIRQRRRGGTHGSSVSPEAG